MKRLIICLVAAILFTATLQAQTTIVADGRMIELYAYHMNGRGPHTDQNVAVATTTGRDAAPGHVDMELVYFAADGEGYRSLQEGAKVSYDPEQGDKGPKAVNVTPL